MVDYKPGKIDLEEQKQDPLVKPLAVKNKRLFSCRQKEEGAK